MKIAVAALFASALHAFAAQYTVDLAPPDTKIEWTLSDVLHTVHGTFRLKSGTITFDTSTGTASGRIVVDVASGESGSDARDKRMHAHVLESRKYPEAVFVPDRIESALRIPGTSDVKLHGTFTIHGAAHEVIMNARTEAGANSIKAALTFDIPYVSWGMKDPSNFLLKVNKTVQMSIETSGALTGP
jgi:polyisoprenoid-binding protein YceI